MTTHPPIPYRIRAVEPIKLLTREQREKKIKEAGLNVFRLRAEDVYIDLLTDSGTGAMSAKQWSAMMVGDESYAGSASFFRLEKSVQEIMGLPFLLPVHQGRAAERVLNHILVKPGQIVPGNSHFDTTKAHIEYREGFAIDCTIDEGKIVADDHPFKGNIDLNKLSHAIEKHGKEKVAYVLITATCNTGGGQPVSMENFKEVSRLCKKHDVWLFMDAARFAENAWFIKKREKGYQNKTVKEIVKEMFSCVDGCTMSSKKDGIVPMGGLVALRDEALFEELKPFGILFEGFYTYGGMSGMDMEALAQGLTEVVEEDYLAHRIGQIEFLGSLLVKKEIPVVKPFGGHAVFVDGRGFFPKVPDDQFPSQLLTVELYKEGGVRAVEVGMCLAGRDPTTKNNIRPALDLCRLTIPRRTYVKEHFEYIADTIEAVHKEKRDISKGLVFEKEAVGIRHFASTFRYA